MRPIARVLIDESHRQAWSTRPEIAARMNPVNPADASYALAAGALDALRTRGVRARRQGALDDTALADVDVLVIPHAADDAWEHTIGTRLAPADLRRARRDRRGSSARAAASSSSRRPSRPSTATTSAISTAAVRHRHRQHDRAGSGALVQGRRHVGARRPVRGPRHDLTAQVAQACFYRAGTLHGVVTDDGGSPRDRRAHVCGGRPCCGRPAHDERRRPRAASWWPPTPISSATTPSPSSTTSSSGSTSSPGPQAAGPPDCAGCRRLLPDGSTTTAPGTHSSSPSSRCAPCSPRTARST